MNKRINDLFGQALDEAVPETWTTLSPVQLMRLRDKFAELIHKECLEFNHPSTQARAWSHENLNELFGYDE